MTSHGTASSLGHVAMSADTSSGYRNLFGDTSRGEQYRGFGDDEAGRCANRRMFRWLATRFGLPYKWPDGNPDNRRIPAGYTYLAQLVIHDTVQTLGDLSDLRNGTPPPRNARSGRLVLDTIYGKGPGADPLFYRPCEAVPKSKGFLRIGGREGYAGPPRDLPRSPCPFTGMAYSDVLIADARNDDNLIIAQLTVLFHLLHNIVYGELRKKKPNDSDAQVFVLARKIVARVYRAIVFKDLLKKLLHPDIYEKYVNEGEKALLDIDDARMPLEFSHAAARFGHFMVRNQYNINDKLQGEKTSVEAILRQTSASRPFDMPVTPEWLIDWRTLFDEGNSLKSRRLGPEMALPLVTNDLEADFGEFDDPTRQQGDIGGLAYRDLVRGAESKLRSVDSIVQHEHLPDYVRQLSPLTRNGGIDSTAVVRWLEAGLSDKEKDLYKADMSCLADDIPLLLFILIEAAETRNSEQDIKNGECLGAIGSVIIAEEAHPAVPG